MAYNQWTTYSHMLLQDVFSMNTVFRHNQRRLSSRGKQQVLPLCVALARLVEDAGKLDASYRN